VTNGECNAAQSFAAVDLKGLRSQGWHGTMRRTILLILIGLGIAACNVAPSTPEVRNTQEVAVWLKENAIPFATTQPGSDFADLLPLKDLVGEARLVALGEATHGTHEFFQMKHRMVEFLVQEMGFTVFALEAYWPEAERINDYVLSGEGNVKELLAGLQYWPWNTQEMLDLIEWIRDYNAQRGGAPPVRFSGFDMQNAKLALNDLHSYLQMVDPDAATLAEANTGCFHPYMDYTFQQVEYAQLGADTKAACRQDLQAVYDSLSAQQATYEARSSPEAVANALHSARLVIQNEAMAAVTEEGDFLTRDRFNSRDEAMAENVSWLLNQAEPQAKMILWAHNAHVQTAAWTFRGTSYAPMGVHLRQAYGDEMVVFGFSFYEGSFNAYAYDTATGSYGALTEHPAGPLPADSVEGYLHNAGIPRFFLDLREMSSEAAGSAWLGTPHWLRFVGAEYDPELPPEDYAFWVSLPKAFDVLIYFDETTPSVLLP
jgi:erythromycin esterase